MEDGISAYWELRRARRWCDIAQLCVIAMLEAMYFAAPRPLDATGSLLTPIILAGFLATTGLRTWFHARPEAKGPDESFWIFADFTFLYLLIYSFHIQYEQGPGVYLKSTTASFAFFLIAIRAVHLELRAVALAGAAAVFGWAGLTLAAMLDPASRMTRSFVEYMTSDAVLIGAQVEHMIGLGLVTTALAMVTKVVGVDGLTGLGNARVLVTQLHRAKARDRGASIILVRAANLHDLANLFGASTANKAIVEVAGRLTAFVGQWGKVWRIDETTFAINHHGLGPGETIVNAMDRLQRGLAEPLESANRFCLTFHLGCMPAEAHVDPLESYRRAHLALSHARSDVEGRSVVYSQALADDAQLALAIERNLPIALENGEFELVYQPIVALGTGEIVGAEALIRWPSRQGDQTSPASFMPVAEATGQIVPIGAWVIERAADDQLHWREQGFDMVVNVNVSPVQVAEWATLEAALRQASERGARLKIEIIEGALSVPENEFVDRLIRLTDHAAGLAIDDFGAGHSSFARLSALPFTTLKIDKALTDQIETPKGRKSMLALARLGRSLGLEIVVEGVESAGQALILGALGIEHAQGFHFARPMSSQQFLGHALGQDSSVDDVPWDHDQRAIEQ